MGRYCECKQPMTRGLGYNRCLKCGKVIKKKKEGYSKGREDALREHLEIVNFELNTAWKFVYDEKDYDWSKQGVMNYIKNLQKSINKELKKQGGWRK